MSSTAPKVEVPVENRSIFRSKALRSYSDREQQSASYTLVTPRSLYLLWALLVLVFSFGVITWLSDIPVFTPAVAVTTDAYDSEDETASPRILLFLPGDHLNKLHVGQNVIVKLNADPHRVMAKIFAVEPEVLSQQAAEKRFDRGIQFPNIGEPKAVAWARLVPPATSAMLNDGGGSIDAWVQTDSKPVLSLFPLMSRVVVQPPDEQGAIGSIGFQVWFDCLTSAQVRSSSDIFDGYLGRALSGLVRERSLQTKNSKTKRRRLYV